MALEVSTIISWPGACQREPGCIAKGYELKFYVVLASHDKGETGGIVFAAARFMAKAVDKSGQKASSFCSLS